MNNCEKIKRKSNPRDRANIFSLLTFLTFEPEAMGNLIGYFSQNSKLTINDAYHSAGLLLGFSILRIFIQHNLGFIVQKFALRVRISFTTLVYRKTLKLAPCALSDITLGNIVTVITKDVVTFEENLWTINDLWSGSLQALYVFYILYSKLGATSLILIGCLFVVMPIQAYLASIVMKWRLQVSKHTDERLQIIQEILSSIKVIKMYTWEKYFNDKVTKVREHELNKMLKAVYLRIIIVYSGLLSSNLAMYAFIMIHLVFAYNINAETIFFVMSCLSITRGLFPIGLAKGAEMYAALVRINKILTAGEVTNEKYVETDDPSIDLQDISVSVNDKPIFKNLSLNLKNGLNVITGKVGSGKSCLLKTIFKDYSNIQGTIKINGTISYASQEPWLFPSSVKQNILFGEAYNEERYKTVIKVCALTQDINSFENGDATILADKGANLSKGQQARINLARAVYKNCDIYLLDDCLTALDHNVQDFIFDNCIQKFLKNKLCVLVTQCEKHIKQADTVVQLSDGNIISISSPEDYHIEDVDKSIDERENLQTTKEETKPVFYENKYMGAIDYSIFIRFLKFGKGWISFSGVVIIYSLAQFADSYTNTLFSKWVDINENAVNLANNSESREYEEAINLSIRALNLNLSVMLISVVINLIKFYFILNFFRIISLNLHKLMSFSVINAALSFFDNHFIGQILNRFSQDLSYIDSQIALSFFEVFRVLFEVIGVIIVISTVKWIFMLPAFTLVIVIIILRQLYMPTGRSLKRLEATTRNAIIGHLNSSFEGSVTIRASKVESLINKEFDEHQDLFTSAHFMFLNTSRAFEFLVDFSSTAFVYFIIMRFLFFDTDATSGDVGLVLTQIFALSDSVQHGIREWADLENQMTWVERILEYEDIKLEKQEGKTIENWPHGGNIAFENVNLIYQNKYHALKNINFIVEAKQKIGIVGRTGCGKSSIVSSLLQLYDTEGTILIDNINIKDISLRFLRRNIATIPQDPILFRGSIRENIDPLNMYSDEEIWKVLDTVKLKSFINNLDFNIIENDNNLSSGQRQLICLARAIIKKSKIVVLDEATANMDFETEAMLHNIINENFTDCTIFIIAHRLQYILNSDKILVLDGGEIIEFDAVDNLLKNKDSCFSKIVQKSQIQNIS